MSRYSITCGAMLLALFGALLAGCERAKSPSNGGTQWVDPNKLEPGPMRHDNLTETQISRIQRLQKTFSEVDPSPVEQWIEDFKRDSNPDRELTIWEEMASAYETSVTSKNLTMDGKKEVYQVVLARSGAPDDEALKHLSLKILTENDAREVMAHFSNKPQPIRVGRHDVR